KETGKEIICYVTKKALVDAPGITVRGVVGESFDISEADLDKVIKDLHKKLEETSINITSPQQRFLRIPFVASCISSDYPASVYDLSAPEAERGGRSTVSLKKREAGGFQNNNKPRLYKVVEELFKDEKSQQTSIKLPINIDQLEDTFEQFEWLSVIHADGNGLGHIFINFKQYSRSEKGRDYLDKYRRFSLALDICTENAFKVAISNLSEKCETVVRRGRRLYETVPVIPLVLGGDDLTVLCDGKYALHFTADFLTAFEEETQKSHQNRIIAEITNKAFGVSRLSSCAGIAIVKPHFPFHSAYELAESLLQSAKLVKTKVVNKVNNKEIPTPCSALDFHVLYDSSNAELKRIRKQLTVKNARLVARPYVVTSGLELVTQESKNWIANRSWKKLSDCVDAILARDENDQNRRKLPNSQLHIICEGLFLGKEEADARMNLIKDRYKEQGFDVLLEGDSLFFEENKHVITGFIDAMDAAGFWE
ncbi:MAG: hypothetical protein JNN15_04835, partial [Blastocatellia bacterium]|nr:hypothetical protein [Blastocatellia bacterium]